MRECRSCLRKSLVLGRLVPSIRSGKVPNCEFDLTVGKLPPILNGRREAVLGNLIDNLAGFATSRVDQQQRQEDEVLRPEVLVDVEAGHAVDI